MRRSEGASAPIDKAGMPKLNSAGRHWGIVMLKIIIWIYVALLVLSAPAWAQDSTAILGKTFEYMAEMNITNGEGAAAKTTVEQSTRKIRITKDGKVFFTVKSEAGGETGTVAKLNKSINLVGSPGMMPDDAANYSYSSYIVEVSFKNGLWRLIGNVKGRSKKDHSECTTRSSTIVGFSPDLTTCALRSAEGTQRCGPPSNMYYHRELLRTVSCTVSSD
jgi:hypothetical protein